MSGSIVCFWSNYSDLTRPGPPKWWLSKGNPPILGKSGLVKYSNLARCFFLRFPMKKISLDIH